MRIGLATLSISWLAIPVCLSLVSAEKPFPSPAAQKTPASLRFVPSGKEEYRFDTGVLRGALRAGGESRGLSSVVHIPTGTEISRGVGLVGHYRLFTTNKRYGHAAWAWPSKSKLLADGAVRADWSAGRDHPFELTAIYRWKAPAVLDVETIVKPHEDLDNFEAFLASYFGPGFSASYACVEGSAAGSKTKRMLEATEDAGRWQVFPRDAESLAIVNDGRWTKPPNPVDWAVRPSLAAPIALRRDKKAALLGAVMAAPKDCFAIMMPYGTEAHYSLYLSLFGHDVKAGTEARALARLIVASGSSDLGVVSHYNKFLMGVAEAPAER
jgi:hypothetical protein